MFAEGFSHHLSIQEKSVVTIRLDCVVRSNTGTMMTQTHKLKRGITNNTTGQHKVFDLSAPNIEKQKEKQCSRTEKKETPFFVLLSLWAVWRLANAS